MKKTCIALKVSTIARLKKAGRFGESYDSLINRLLDELEGEKRK